MVTDLDGRITQNVVYIPYGEVFVEERNGSWASPYLFNAKELDEETGLYYYGARYLDPAGARWLSVDPMWENDPDKTPYNYCLNNPVKLVDPDGKENVLCYANTNENALNINKGRNYRTRVGNIDFHGHGNTNSITKPDGTYITNGEEFDDYLSESSYTWKQYKASGSSDFIPIRLHSCQTGKKKYKEPIAQVISKSEKFKNALIIAPTTKVKNYGQTLQNGEIIKSSCIEVGAYEDKGYAFINGIPYGTEGKWNCYFRGMLVTSLTNDEANVLMNSPTKLQEMSDLCTELGIRQSQKFQKELIGHYQLNEP
ncbi:MAG: RHS repeat-associated core domain-containing protein [Paludibacteraceae bacterium]|nr:RHS repeat-associated core domain-containing protein [Paludibacteraceae bacterium]